MSDTNQQDISGSLFVREEKKQLVRLENGEYAPYTYLECAKRAMRFTWEAKRANLTGRIVQIDLTEDNQTVVLTSSIREENSKGLLLYSKKQIEQIPFDIENPDHLKLVNSFGAIFIPDDE